MVNGIVSLISLSEKQKERNRKNCILRKLSLLTEKTKFQSGTSLLLIIKFVYLVNLKKIFSINLEVAVFLQRHQSETTEDMFKI